MAEPQTGTATNSEAGKRRAKRGRSPSYPGISLAAAIDRARTVWEHEKRNATPVRVMMKHWGYTNPAGGLAAVTFSALKKFGLVEDEGSGPDRLAKLTELAFEILNNPHPEQAVREAALRPPIHRELWEQYATELPSGESLKWTLLQRGFTESGASEFIREYRETIAFARLNGGTPKGAADADHEELEDEKPPAERPGSRQTPPNPRNRGGMRGNVLTIPVPVIGGSPVTIEGEFPITEAAWDQFMAVLGAMKPGLVAEPQEENDDDE
jgi:hypothetical protein